MSITINEGGSIKKEGAASFKKDGAKTDGQYLVATDVPELAKTGFFSCFLFKISHCDLLFFPFFGQFWTVFSTLVFIANQYIPIISPPYPGIIVR